jgi:hypothetical protein
LSSEHFTILGENPADVRPGSEYHEIAMTTLLTEQELQHELSYYTLALGDPAFIHQHIVDAFAAQNATPASKPIQVVFALLGLYLHLERRFTGREVQRAHMRLGTPRRNWIMPRLPEHRGAIRVAEVLAAPAGAERDRMIDAWCASVWAAYAGARGEIAEIACSELEVF